MAGCEAASFYIRVALIEGVPKTGEAGTPLTLTGTVRPAFASKKDIVWTVKDAGTTGAVISGNVLNAAAGGTVTIRARIANGMSEGSDYTQDFEIVFIALKTITDIAVKTQPAILIYYEGETLDLSGLVVTLTYDDDSTEDVGLAGFASRGLSTSPAQGTPLNRSAHNGQPVTVTAGGYSANTDNLTVERGIPSVALAITGPAKNEKPDTVADIADGGHYTAGAVSWSPNDNPFKGETAYTAMVTLAADEDYIFPHNVTAAVNGNSATVSGNTGTAVTISYTFAKTLAKEITGITVKSQPTKLTYTSGETLNLSGLVVTLTFDIGPPEDVAHSNFNSYNISESPPQGTALNRSAHNGHPVVVSVGTYSKNTDNLTVIEPITNAALTVTSPAKNGTPDTAAVIADGGHYTAGAVSWSPNDNPFKGETAYMATVTLTADTGYTFMGLTAVAVNGKNATVSGNTGTAVTISYTFEPTQAKAVANIAINSQPAKRTYTHGDMLDLSGLSVKLTYDDYTTEDVALAGFTAKNISANPANGSTLSRTTHNNKPVKVSIDDHSVNTDNLTVNKAKGAPVGTPVAAGNASSLSITVTAVTEPGNGQTVEYAINTTTTAPSSGWKDTTTFTDLSANITYYIFARSKANDNYDSGTASVSAATIIFYTVTFNSNGGSAVTAQNVLTGGKAAAPTNPTRSGHTFDGWYKEAAFDTKWDFNANTVTTNITLYAKWIPLYTVSFNANGGNPPASQIVEAGGKAARPADPVRQGYDFVDWYSNSGLTTLYNFNAPVTGNITLHAKWVELISAIAIEVTGPGKGETPNTTATVSASADGSYTAGSVSWSPNDNPFKGSTRYTATVTVTAKAGSKFTASPSAEINGLEATIKNRTDTSVTISYTFAETLTKAFKGISIDSQPATLTYNHGDKLNLTGLSVKLTYDDYTTEDVALAGFTGKNISADPADDDTLSHLVHDNQPVKVSIGSHHTDTSPLKVKKATPTITFPTAAAIIYGMKLSQSALTGGSSTPSGAFMWQDIAAVPNVTNSGYPVEFTPDDTDDTDNYDFTTGVSGWNSVTGKVVRNVSITVSKAAGAVVGTPVIGSSSSLSITVNAVTPPGNGQAVEYAKNTTTDAPSSGWQDGRTFSGLTAGTTYYIFARSKESANYNAGPASDGSAPINFYTVTFNSNGGTTVTAQNILSGGNATKPTDPDRSGYSFDGWYTDTGFNTKWNFSNTIDNNITLYAKWLLSYSLSLTFEQISEQAPTPSATTISRSGANGRPKTTTISVSNPTQYSSITWVIPSYGITETNSSITLDSMAFMVGKHYITVEVWKDGKPYSRTITFEVVK